MMYIVHDAHTKEHTPKLIIDNPDSFRITDVEVAPGPYSPPDYTTIYFSYKDDEFYISDKFDIRTKLDIETLINKGETRHFVAFPDKFEEQYLTLYKKTGASYRLLDYVFDNLTYLHRIRNKKINLLIRMTDVKLIGGYYEQEVEHLHKEIEELDKRRYELHRKLYAN